MTTTTQIIITITITITIVEIQIGRHHWLMADGNDLDNDGIVIIMETFLDNPIQQIIYIIRCCPY